MSDASVSPVVQPVTIDDLQLKNRIVMAPLTRSRSNEEGVPPAFAGDYYGQRATANASSLLQRRPIPRFRTTCSHG